MNILSPSDFPLSHVKTSKLSQWIHTYAYKIDEALSGELEEHLKENNGQLNRKDFLLEREEESIRCYFLKDLIQDRDDSRVKQECIEKESSKIAIYGDKENPRVMLARKYIHEEFSRILHGYQVALHTENNRELSFIIDEFAQKWIPRNVWHFKEKLTDFVSSFYDGAVINRYYWIEHMHDTSPAIDMVRKGSGAIWPLSELDYDGFIFAATNPPSGRPDDEKNHSKIIIFPRMQKASNDEQYRKAA